MINPFKLLAIYSDLNKGEAVAKEKASMKVKIPQLVSLFVSLSATLGLPTLVSGWVHTHIYVYLGIVTAAIVLHAVMPSVFAAPSDADLQATGLNKVGVLLLAVVLMNLFAIRVQAQDPTLPSAPTPTPAALQNLYAAGASYAVNSSPGVAGTALYAHLLSDGTGTYAFTVVDALPASVKPFTVTSNIGIGVAQRVATLGKVTFWVPTSAGVSWSGANVGWQWNGGGAATIPLKSGYYLVPTVRFLKSSISGGSGYQPIVGLLFGWGK
jgi:hypothetical protein